MPNPPAVFLDLASVSQDDINLAPLEQAFSNWEYFSTTKPAETAQRTEQAELVVTNKVILDQEILQQSRNLKLICIAATGTNNIDLAAAKELGIRVTNVASYSTPSVVQQVFAMILSLTTRQAEYTKAIRQGHWQQSSQFCLLDYPFHELSGRRMGIVGYGELGHNVAKVAEAFGMEIMLSQRPGGPAQPGRIPLDKLLPQVDVLSLHCPLTPETEGLIGAKELSSMQRNSLLINCARGGVVNEEALAQALINGQLGGAGIDVLANEPPTQGNPLLNPKIPNLIVTPHIAWASVESRQRLVNGIADNIKAFFTGEEKNIVV